MIKEYGPDITKDEGSNAARLPKRYIGLPLPPCVELIQSDFDVKLPKDFISRYEERMYPVLKQEIEPVAGIREILPLLPCKTCVASGGPMSKLAITLGASGLLPFFEGRVFCSDHVQRGKPHPDIFLFAAREMGVTPSACVVIEDSENRIRAGLAAGMRVLAYDPERVLGPQPNEVIRFGDMRELPKLLGTPAVGA